MKKYFILFLFVAPAFIFSQQNFINVPSADVTAKHKLFFQQQFNFNELIQSNTTINMGLGKGFECGLNILGLNFSDKNRSFIINDTTDEDPYNPLVLLNGLKSFQIAKNTSFAVGSQYGFNFRDNKKRREAGLFYCNLRFNDVLVNNSVFVIGSYYNTMHYGGKGNRFGAWAGTEIPLRKNLHFMAESVFGTNSLCYTSLGIIYYPVKKIPLTLGVQIPNTKNNAWSLVFELTFVPGED